ncbi:MAG: sugar fermentation stimulation protein A, partial [Candidatus Krumholzibacteriia bacterium]
MWEILEGYIMRFDNALVPASFVCRQKRFFIHAKAANGVEIIAHTNNTGRMTGCLFPSGTIWLSPATNPKRKLKWSLELIETDTGVLVGVNTILANDIVAEAIAQNLIPPLAGFSSATREVKYGRENSRIDILLQSPEQSVWVEVKNVSLVNDGHGRFPDAPSVRARKHLHELMSVVADGDRAALVLCSQRSDVNSIGPADDIDPEYGKLLRNAMEAGVEIYGLSCDVTTEGIVAQKRVQI